MIALGNNGYQPVIVDNFCNSKLEVIDRIAQVLGARPECHVVDIRDPEALGRIVRPGGFHAVLHFAGLKSVAESVSRSSLYFDVNVRGTRILCDVLNRCDVRRMVFSSSATVYGNDNIPPVREDAPCVPSSPYGENKLLVEKELGQLANSGWRVAMLRYFNPVGAHKSGLIGEDPAAVPSNLMPRICQVAAGELPHLSIFGNDYNTADGTGVRDYVHVVDLVDGHLAALQRLEDEETSRICLNLGTGRGYSVLQLIETFQRVTGKKIPISVEPRRPGDIASSFANVDLAESVLAWRAKKGIEEMCSDAWRWHRNN